MSEDTLLLNNGTAVTIRPICEADAILIHDMHRRLSLNSIYHRYLRPRRPTFEEIESLCRLNHNQGAAFVAEIASPLRLVIGLGHYLIKERGWLVTVELALLVQDKFQGQGVGRALLQHLSQKALSQQVQIFEISLQAENRRMMKIIERSGLPFESQTAYGIQQVRLRLESAAGQLPNS